MGMRVRELLREESGSTQTLSGGFFTFVFRFAGAPSARLKRRGVLWSGSPGAPWHLPPPLKPVPAENHKQTSESFGHAGWTVWR